VIAMALKKIPNTFDLIDITNCPHSLTLHINLKSTSLSRYFALTDRRKQHVAIHQNQTWRK